MKFSTHVAVLVDEFVITQIFDSFLKYDKYLYLNLPGVDSANYVIDDLICLSGLDE